MLRALYRLKAVGNSLFVVEHDLDVIRHADLIVDVGPAAGESGSRILYSGPPAGLRSIEDSQTRHHLFTQAPSGRRESRTPRGWLRLADASRNNLHRLQTAFPLGLFTSVTGVSGSGKSSLVSQALVEMVAERPGHILPVDEEEGSELQRPAEVVAGGRITAGMEAVKRLVTVDQKPIGRTPRSNLATYTGLFDQVRKLFAATRPAKVRGYDAGRFSFNVAKGRCRSCEDEGFVMVELLFLPSIYTPCPACQGGRYNEDTLKIKVRGKNIAEVLGLTVDAACDFFAEEPQVLRPLAVLRDVGLGYIRLGQPATELSGGEGQRIEMATELQRTQRGDTPYVLDEPTTGYYPADVEKLMTQLDGLVESGNTVIVVEHEMEVVASSDRVVDVGPGAGDEGGHIVASGPPAEVVRASGSRKAACLARYLDGS